MAEQQQLQVINQIAEALSSGERKRLLYLCESMDTDNSVGCMKETLKYKVSSHDSGQLLLRELMLQLRRFDILRKVCKTSRDEVERTLKIRQVLPRFRVLMADISEDMTKEDVKSFLFLVSSVLPGEKRDEAKSFLDVIIELEKLDKVSPESVDFVEERLRDIGRIDLAKKVKTYRMSAVTPELHSSQQQRCRAPRLFTPLHSCQPVQHTRPELLPHSATEHRQVSLHGEQRFRSQLDLYKFNTNPRGVCVIIDCVGYDGDMLEETFKALHFKVLHYKLLSVNETLQALRGIFKKGENPEGDGFVCCIISRGTSNRLLGTDSYGAGLYLDTIRRLFTADACPVLVGKPKLFFIQRYSVPEFQPYAGANHHEEDLETDGCDGLSRRDFIPTDADVFWSHCWTDEQQLQQGHHRSIYLKALTDALHKGERRKAHLVDVHTEVNGSIFDHNRRNPGAEYHIDLKHTLRKNLYLQ